MDGRIQTIWTNRGLILAAFGLSLFAMGMWRVDGVMASMGLCVGVLFVVVWLLGKYNLRQVGLEYRGPQRVDCGKGFSGKLILTNRRKFSDCFWIEFGVSLMGEGVILGKSFWTTGGGNAAIEARMVLRKRGWQDVQSGWVKSGFPLGLMSFSKKMWVKAEIGVLPKPMIPRALALSGYLLDGAPFGGSRHFGGIGEWKGLRERRSGDNLRRIAWAATLRSEAAGGAMLVREDEPPGSQAEGCLVVFHSYGGDGNLIRPDRFEKALALFCGTLGSLIGWGMPVRWVADFDEWEENILKTRRQLAQVREDLMTATRAAGTEAHDLIAALGKAREHECVVVISDMPRPAWEGFVPRAGLEPVLLDIRDYDGSRRKRKAVRK